MSVFVISCGGTGGHLAPGIALAEGLIARGHKCSLIISNKEVDSRLVSNYPHLEFIKTPGVGFSRKPSEIFRFAYNQLKALLGGINVLRNKKPDIVIGFGGFTTVGIGLAAFILGYPLVLHEANRVAGKAIRLLSVLARRVYLPPGVDLKSLPPKTIRHFGYPVRKDIRPLIRNIACKRLGLESDVKRLLVVGGSQGAMVLNDWVLSNFERLAAEGINVYCITDVGKNSKGKLEYEADNGEVSQAIFTPFVDNMAEVLSCADLVLSRAGAGSIAEFSRCYLPAILVPYEYAADNHQEENAKFFERQGGGIVVKESSIDTLYDEIVAMIYNDWVLDKFRRNLKRTEVHNSLNLIVNDLESLANQQEPVFYPKSFSHS